MKTLILTEKPSVAMDFAKALGVQGRRDGYIENDRYIITWAVGHLVELFEPQEYDPKWKKWSLDTLPIAPDSFQYKPISKTKKQFSTIKKLLKAHSFERIAIATDAGREGEVIARTILLTAGFKDWKIIFRFWSSLALTPQVVREGMELLKPLVEYDRLWNAGQARQIADWLVGMNFSRAATVTLRDLFSVGRVQTAVLALLVDRRRERESFKPQPYWLLVVQFSNEKGNWLGTWFRDKQTRFDVKEEAEQVLAKILHQSGEVLSVKKEKKKQPPPPLYSLTDLQQDANKKYGFTAQETLDTAQKLYEKLKCLSYPRTDSKVLGAKNVDMAQNLVRKLSQTYPSIFAGVENRLIDASNKRVFNDAKLTDHHALIPLAPIPKEASDGEKKIHELVLKRFAAAFHADCEYEQTEIITVAVNETFRSKGKIILKPGWQSVYGIETEKPDSPGDEPDQENLPPLQNGDPARAEDAHVSEKKTTPPPDYTEALLLKDMTNPGKYVSEEDFKKIFRGDVGLGTQATRAQIIETLLKRQYVLRKKKYLLATDKGCLLIDTLRQFRIAGHIASASETARWEMQLDRIAQGQEASTQFLETIRTFVDQSIREMKNVPVQIKISHEQDPQEIGICPRCGGTMIEGKRGYGCSNWKPENGGCSFVIWKEIGGVNISRRMIGDLLTSKKIGPFDGVPIDETKTASAYLKLVQDGEGWKTEWETAESPKPKKPRNKTAGEKKAGETNSNENNLGLCPDCGGEIVEGKKGYGCKNWRDRDGGCKFVIWKTIAKKKIPKKAVRQLLKNGRTDVIQGFQSKEGNSFSCRLKIQKSESFPSKIIFEFESETG